MAGHLQIARVIRRPPTEWRTLFAAVDGRAKVTCVVCGRSGYPGTLRPYGWQASCLLGHPEQCPTCGARFIRGGYAQHLRCPLNHEHCPEHCDTQHRRLLRAKGGPAAIPGVDR